MSKKFLQTLSLSTVLFYGVAGDVNAAENACKTLAKCGSTCKDSGWRDACRITCKSANWELCMVEATAYYAKKDPATAEKEAKKLVSMIWKDSENDSNYCTNHQDACDFTS